MLTPYICVHPPLRSGPDPGQHVPDRRDQPRPRNPARPGRHGARRHAHRQHGDAGRPGGGGGDPGAVTVVTLDGADASETGRGAPCNVRAVFKMSVCRGSGSELSMHCLLCKDIAFVSVFFFLPFSFNGCLFLFVFLFFF